MSLAALEDVDEDLPDILPGEVVHNDNGDLSFKVISQVGAGRCCVVYKAVAVRDTSLVALKCFRRGPSYEGAVQRESFILERMAGTAANIVTCYAVLTYRGYTFFVLELLQDNIRQIIFKNDRHGLSPWLVVKFARDLLSSLASLHKDGIVHADLKPHNVLWCGQDKVFKTIDFGLSFSVEEAELHQVQTTGYRSPEAEVWDHHKETQRVKRKRKLEGTFQRIDKIDFRNKNLQENLLTPSDATPVQANCDITRENTYTHEITHSEESEAQPQPHHHTIYLQHSDSHSSGIYSQENSERSQYSLNHEFKDGNSSKIATSNHIHDQSRDAIKENLLCNKLEVSSSCNSIINIEDEAVDKVGDDDIQVWRKTRCKSVVGDRARLTSASPPRPGTAADMWSYGCLLAEVLTGRKLFQAGDKLASVLRPAQLLEMKLGDTEAVWAEQGCGDMFSEVKDFIIRCISEDPSERIEAEEAVSHPIFSYELSPSDADLTLLPTPTLKFSLISPVISLETEQQLLDTIVKECRSYGDVVECRLAPGGCPLVCFQEVGSAVFASQCLRSKLASDCDSDNDDIMDITDREDQDIVTIDDYKFSVTFYI